MIGRMIGLGFCIVGMIGLAAISVHAAGPAKDDLILPNSSKMRLEKLPGGNSTSVSVDRLNINWPAKVKGVNGQWLQINDEGGYTLPGKTLATGWVRKDEVALVEEALAKLSSDIATNEASLKAAESKTTTTAKTTKATKDLLARLYWLRGIYWETDDPKGGHQPQIALADYRAATCHDGKLADAWLRRGRMLATIDSIANQAGPEGWLACFKKAYHEFQCLNAPKRAATAKPCACAKCTTDVACRECSAAVPENAPKPRERAVGGICFSDRAPPQLYLDLGLAYKTLYDSAGTHIYAWLFSRMHYDWASFYLQCAEWSNHYWFRPASARGDLLLARAKKNLDLDDFGIPSNTATVSAADLVEAVDKYDHSIRLNDQFDEAFRGRAQALRLLANDQAKNAVLDKAYESAKKASFLRKDRSSESLAERGQIEIDLAYSVDGNLAIEYMAQASETLKDGLLYSRSTTSGTQLNQLIFRAATESSYVLAYFAAQDDIQFAPIWNRAKKMKACVDRLWKKLTSLNSDDLAEYRDLVEAVASSHRAIDEINEIQPFRIPKVAVREGAAGKADLKTKTAYGAERWPTAFPPRSELVDRYGRAGAWKLILDALKQRVETQVDSDAIAKQNGKKPCPLHNELKDCMREWRKKRPTRT